MKAILIARVSTEEQREAGNSLPAQIARLEKYCHNKNFTIIKTCSFDESAYKSQRDEFDHIIDFILNQKEKIVVCCDKVDRISRNIFDKRISNLYDKALQDEVELHFVSDGQIITSNISAVEKFQFSISLGLAKYYSDAISDNVKRAQEQKLRKGEWLAKAPYGYKNITNPDKITDIVVDEYESAVVKKMYELYATGAYSLALIKEKLKKDYGLKWARCSIAKLLSNPFYHGIMIVKNKEYPHRYPPVISKTLFDEVQKIKNGFNKKPIKYAGRPFLYRGLLRCGDCGLAITPEMHKGLSYYHCTQYRGKHNAAWFREEAITKEFEKIFKNLQMPKEILEQVVGTLDSVHHDKVEFHNKQFDKLTREQKTLTKMLDNLYLDKLKGSITDSQYDKFYQSLRDEITEITIRLEQLQDAEDNYYITVKYLLDLCSRAYDLFLCSEVEEKRMLIRLVLSNVSITGKKIVWQAHKPFNLILETADSKLWRG